MTRVAMCIIAFGIIFSAASGRLWAQVTLGPQGPVASDRPKPEDPQIDKLDVDPASEPSPALRYSLLPRELEQKPGNGVPYYYRALLMFGQQDPETRKAIDQWSEMRPDELRTDDVQRALGSSTSVLEALWTAAYRETCDWQWRIGDLDGEQQITFLLPEINEARSLARLLSVKAGVEIAERRYDDALQTLTVGYKLARDVAEPPTLVNDLVGIAIATVLTDRLRELIDAPGSPNLYWALAELPRPLIDMRAAMRQEVMLPLVIFPFLRDAETAVRSPDQWRDLVLQAFDKIPQLDGTDRDSKTQQLIALARIATGYPRAKRELVAAGYPPDQVERMSVGQVVAIHQARTSAYIYQEMFKWTLLPYDQAEQHQARTGDRLDEQGYLGDEREIIPVARLLLPAFGAARRAEVQLSARLAVFQAIEALRLHAADHGGELPESLADIKAVPVPNNPLTGQPFVYRRDGNTATFEVQLVSPARPWRLEVTISQP